MQPAGHALAAQRLGSSDAGGVEHEGGGEAGDELDDAAQRVGVFEGALQFGVDDRVDLSGLVAAGVADRLLAVGVGPAGTGGDHVAVLGGEQVANDRRERAQLVLARVDQPCADVVAEPDVAGDRVGVADALLRALPAILGGRVQLAVVEPGAGEVGLLAGGSVVGVVELLVDGVEHEHGSMTQMPAATSGLRSCT